MTQLKRYTTSHGIMCDAAEVADLEKKLEAYQDALDCIKDAMKYAAAAIADPDSVAYVDLPNDTMTKSCETCKHYSFYDGDDYHQGIYQAVFRNSCEIHEDPKHRYWDDSCDQWEGKDDE